MAIKKTEDGRYRVQVEVGRKADGSRDRRTRTVATRRDATALEADWTRIRDAREGMRARGCTLGLFVDGYWRPMKESSLRQTSLDSYEQDLRLRILPRFGDREMSSITRADVQAMVTSCGSESTAKRSRDLLRAILNEAVSAGFCDSNPAAGRFQMPRGVEHAGDGGRGAWLTTFEQHRPVLEAAKGRGEIEKIVVLGLCMGLRKEEILGLNAGDLDFDEGVAHVCSAYVQTSKGNVEQPTKTPESKDAVPMPAYARGRLLELSEGIPPRKPFVQSRTGGRLSPSTATKMMRRFVEDNGLPPLTIGAMRHSFASACLDAGIDVAKVSRWLRHTTIMTTVNRYIKTRRSDLDAAAGAIDAALGSPDDREGE